MKQQSSAATIAQAKADAPKQVRGVPVDRVETGQFVSQGEPQQIVTFLRLLADDGRCIETRMVPPG